MMNARQIHCWLDCFAYLIEHHCGQDPGPMYIGSWNAAFESNQDGIYYFSKRTDAMNWPDRFRRLYGGRVTSWLDYRASKQQNLEQLMKLMEENNPNRAVLIIVDLFWIPYAPPYQTKHNPHIIIVKQKAANGWYVEDPYLGWKGIISLQDLESAFYYEDLAKGLMVDMEGLHAPNFSQIDLMMAEQLHTPPDLLTAELEKYLSVVTTPNDGRMTKPLFASIEQVGVISKRMGGYAMVMEYFSKGREHEAETSNPRVKELLKCWESLMLSMARLVIVGNRIDLEKISQRLRDIEALEATVKQDLMRLYKSWYRRRSEHEPVRST